VKRRWARETILTVLVVALPAAGGASAVESVTNGSPEEVAIRKVISDYGRAIETKDVTLFKAVKPNLTQDEERRTRAAFAAVKSQVVHITIVSVDVDGNLAVARVSRRDTINNSLVSSFPQTFRFARERAGWVIQEIGK
jgi:hypothetical protein